MKSFQEIIRKENLLVRFIFLYLWRHESVISQTDLHFFGQPPTAGQNRKTCFSLPPKRLTSGIPYWQHELRGVTKSAMQILVLVDWECIDLIRVLEAIFADRKHDRIDQTRKRSAAFLICKWLCKFGGKYKPMFGESKTRRGKLTSLKFGYCNFCLVYLYLTNHTLFRIH